MKHLKKFNENLYDEQSSDINDDLKSNFRSWEQDHDNHEDTDKLSRILAHRHTNMNMDEIWKIACDWTGFEEDIKESKDPIIEYKKENGKFYKRNPSGGKWVETKENNQFDNEDEDEESPVTLQEVMNDFYDEYEDSYIDGNTHGVIVKLIDKLKKSGLLKGKWDDSLSGSN